MLDATRLRAPRAQKKPSLAERLRAEQQAQDVEPKMEEPKQPILADAA